MPESEIWIFRGISGGFGLGRSHGQAARRPTDAIMVTVCAKSAAEAEVTDDARRWAEGPGSQTITITGNRLSYHEKERKLIAHYPRYDGEAQWHGVHVFFVCWPRREPRSPQ